MHLVCLEICLQAVTALQDISTNLTQKNGTRKHIQAKHILPGSDLVSFLNEGNCLRLGTCAAMIVRRYSVLLCGSAGTTMLRKRRISGLASTRLGGSEIRCKIRRHGRCLISVGLPGLLLRRTGMETRKLAYKRITTV
jgi:hypothetical protein